MVASCVCVYTNPFVGAFFAKASGLDGASFGGLMESSINFSSSDLLFYSHQTEKPI